MPRPLSAPGEDEIEQQTRVLAGCPQCLARRGRACYPLSHEVGMYRGAYTPGSHTGRLRVALQHPAWRGLRPKLDRQPDCQICAIDPAGHTRARLADVP